MNLPFTPDQFLNVFREYNLSVWPMQIVLVLLGLTAIYFAVVRHKPSNMIIAGILAFLWLWMGVVYHFRHFTTINPAAYAFGSLCIIQGLVFVFSGMIRTSLSFESRTDVYGIVGAVMVLYALIVYPILGYFQGHIYPHSPTFGAPCPTTIFTFALLLWADRKVPVYVLLVPFLWSLIASSAALSLGILEDIGLLVSGLVATVLILIRNRRGHLQEKTVEYAVH
ncbi:hypothetical protein EHM92_05140 [bacterium]|nr:MAG: hypothetical protein EHM92_05140 [bacterium]